MKTATIKTTITFLAGLMLCNLFLTPKLRAEDMRDVQIQYEQSKEALIEKAEAEKAAADKAAAAANAKITSDRQTLEKAIAELETGNKRLEEQINRLSKENETLNKKEDQLTARISETSSMIKELVGVIRVNAKDIDGMIAQNMQTALDDTPTDFLESIAQESRFPGMEDVRSLADALRRQIKSSGEVSIRQGTIIDRSGREAEADLLVVGAFTVAYRIGGEVGFCNYSIAGNKLYALSRLPSRRIQKQITSYMDGRSDAVPMDISRGGALRQLTHELSLWEQVPKGGPIVWPILALLAVGVLIILERVIFLIRKHMNGDRLISRIEALATQNKWEECTRECDRYKRKPVARVICAGLTYAHMQREEMENALQEAILKEVPPMERFLAMLGMLAAIAPLLGLLGTVTGMIDTFHIITLYGTGDPRLMSGGISVALVTTMLGLSVAIPLMLAQTLLNRAVDKHIGQMEEKAVALVNIIHKNRSMAQ